MNDSGSHLVASRGSILIELAINASRRSGVRAMFDGGPMTEFCTLVRCWTAGGNVEKFRIVIESGSGVAITLGVPDVRSIFVSLPDRTICADAEQVNASRARLFKRNLA